MLDSSQIKSEIVGIISKDNAEHYNWGNNSDGWHLLKSDSLSVIQERVAPGACERRHYHSKAQQFFYILSGTAHIIMSDVEYEIVKDKGFHIAPKKSHHLVNLGSEDLVFLLISEPKSHGDRVSEE